jgi:CBS domain-containing protein
MRVSDVMTKNYVAVGPDTLISKVQSLLIRYHLNDVLITDNENKLLGIVTYSDICCKLLPDYNEIDEVLKKADKMLELKSGRKIAYDKLVLAVGSTPIMPPITGTNKEGVFLVRKSHQYLSQMRTFAQKIQNIVIIGGGYIGVEMADEALKAGKNVTRWIIC